MLRVKAIAYSMWKVSSEAVNSVPLQLLLSRTA
jgi:hypothetical protein